MLLWLYLVFEDGLDCGRERRVSKRSSAPGRTTRAWARGQLVGERVCSRTCIDRLDNCENPNGRGANLHGGATDDEEIVA